MANPIWRNPELIADELTNYSVRNTDAQKFITTLAKRLEVDPALAIPGYEDAWHYMLRERQLPVNVDPLASRLEDAEERKRIAPQFSIKGLNTVIGYVLPIQRRLVNGQVRWYSGPWFLRREHLFLMPGDSPMGLRLPLDSLPQVAHTDKADLRTRSAGPVAAAPGLPGVAGGRPRIPFGTADVSAHGPPGPSRAIGI